MGPSKIQTPAMCNGISLRSRYRNAESTPDRRRVSAGKAAAAAGVVLLPFVGLRCILFRGSVEWARFSPKLECSEIDSLLRKIHWRWRGPGQSVLQLFGD